VTVPSALDADIEAVLVTADEIAQKTTELAKTIDADYADREPLLVGVLKGAAMFMSDLALALERPSTMEFMAVVLAGPGGSCLAQLSASAESSSAQPATSTGKRSIM